MVSRSAPVELLTTDFQGTPLPEVLQAPPTALLGVAPAAATALAEVGITSVFDLALSRVFAAADQLTDAADDPANPFFRFGAPATDMVDPGLARTLRVQDLRFKQIGVLAGIPDGDSFAAALG